MAFFTIEEGDMIYTADMILRSNSGFCMPFDDEGGDVEMSLGYGEQTHPVTGEPFFHDGVDIVSGRRMLLALADGKVTAVGTDAVHGMYQIISYGKYEVMYGRISNVYMNFGDAVKAGDAVSLSGDTLHIGVLYDSEAMNPLDFLAMVYGNMRTEREAFNAACPDFVTLDGGDAGTRYDKDKDKIMRLMTRYFPSYMNDLYAGQYVVPERTESSLRNLFTLSAARKYFFETMPSMRNPLGLGPRSAPLAAKVQDILIGDFLNYMLMRHGIGLDGSKKKTSPE